MCGMYSMHAFCCVCSHLSVTAVSVSGDADIILLVHLIKFGVYYILQNQFTSCMQSLSFKIKL